MATFAELDENNVVLQVIKVDNSVVTDDFGNESEGLGIAFCRETFGDNKRWVQCSYTGAFRVNYPSMGYTYSTEHDAFIPPRPHSNWVLDTSRMIYIPPIPYPSDGQVYRWEQSTNSWEFVSATNEMET